MNTQPLERDMMKKMLAKGDAIRPRYNNFDFDRLDST